MIKNWVGGIILESLIFAAGYFGSSWTYRTLLHAQYLPRFVTLHGFQMGLLTFAGLMGGMLFWRFFLHCQEEARWGALLFAACVSMALAVPLWFYCANNVHPGHQADKNQEWALLAALGAILINGLPLWVAVQHDELEAGRTDHLRGTQVMKGGRAREEFKKLLKKEVKKGEQPGIAFWDDCRLPRSKETEHLLFVGSTGAGKTQVMYPILEEIMARGDKVVIWDAKGTYTQALTDRPGVGLLAPWDRRSLHWQLGLDVTTQLDCHQLATAMVPEEPHGANQYFYDAPRLILETVFLQLHGSLPRWGWKDLWDVIGQGSERLSDFLNRSAEGRAIIDSLFKARSIGEVYSNLMTATRTVKWLTKAWPDEGISLRQWVTQSTGPQVLVLGGIAQWDKLAGDSANFAVQTLVEQVLSMTDDPQRRVWFFLDELASLGKMPAINRLSTMGRSKGACIVAGIQDLVSLENLYGREMARSLANSFGTMIFMRCTDAETSSWASDVIGEQEVRQHQKSRSQGTHSGQQGSSSESESIQQVTQRRAAFLASEIANLGRLEGIFRLAGWPVAHLGWGKYRPLPKPSPLIEEAYWVRERIQMDEPKQPPLPSPEEPHLPEAKPNDEEFNI